MTMQELSRHVLIACELDEVIAGRPRRRSVSVSCVQCNKPAQGCPHALDQARRNEPGRNIAWICNACLIQALDAANSGTIVMPDDTARRAATRDMRELN